MKATTSQAALTRQEFDLFRAYIEQESSISLDDEKTYLLESRLKRLVAEYDCGSYGDLYNKVKYDSVPLLKSKIIDAITTNETLWFRDRCPFTILDEVFLPDMAQQLSKGKPKVRIWSAACSTGQEPYSIAMVINEFCMRKGHDVVNPSQFEILATDISGEAVATGRLGAYDRLAMTRGMPERFSLKYFKQVQNYWVINADLKKMVEFKEHNLQQDFSSLGTFDMILCRNVAIYFTQQFKQQLFERLRDGLRPAGMFFLGSSETLTYYSSRFQVQEYNNCTYYTC